MSDKTLQKAPPALSIVVPVRDRWDDTFQLLLTLVRMPLKLPLEIVVVDDGSKDESKVALPRLDGPILHQNEEPLGLVRAANQGAALARAPFLLFLTQGAIPSPGPILALLAALCHDPDLSAAGPCLCNPAPRDPAPDADAAAAFGARTGQARKAGLPPLPALPLQGLLLRTSSFREVGGFDASFRDGLAEVDLCWRLQDRGGRIARVEGALLDVSAIAGEPPARSDDALLAERWDLRFGPQRLPPEESERDPLDASTELARTPGAFPSTGLSPVARLDAAPKAPKDPGARPLAVCSLLPDVDGTYEIELRLEDGRRRLGGKVRRAYSEPLCEVSVPYLPSGVHRTVTPAEVVAFFANGYDFEAESARYAAARRPGEPARIAFTAVHADLMSGGSINLFRMANWLVDMGAEVAIYADGPMPSWVKLNARFHAIADPAERYAAIKEGVVVAFSSLELQRLLRNCDHRGKRIYHLCQGAEEFHYACETPPPLLAPNGLFDLLNAVPVGRIVVSPHLERYFGEKYGQRTETIVNGIDAEIFRPRTAPRRHSRGELTVLVSGIPHHPLKGISVVKEALTLLSRRRPRLPLRLLNLCGLRLPLPAQTQEDGFFCEMWTGLTPPEVRDQLHRADVYVNASWYEGFGLPSLEAMACGVPVVQTDNHGLDGIARDGKDCLFVPPQAPEAVAAALERILLEPGLAERLVEGGKATAALHTLTQQREATSAAFSRITSVPLLARTRPEAVEAGGERPRFSVLLPTFNQARFLPKALDSLLAQTDPDWEALLVDDGSTDATAEVMARYALLDRRIHPFHQENGGVASALNRGLRESRGDWICWLSSDDLFLPEKLSLHREAAQKDPGLRFMHTNFLLLHEKTGEATHSGISAEGFVPPLAQQVVRFLRINYVNGISTALHRSVLDRVGGFDEEFRYGQDFDLWLRVSARYRSTFLDKPTCVTRLHASQGTALFTEAGIYDSARAAASFLLRHPFGDLFPTLDLSQAGQALQALAAALTIAHSPDAFVVRCGFGALLRERMKQWLGELPDRLRAMVGQEILASISHQANPEVKKSLRELVRVERGYPFLPADPHALLAEHLEGLEERGERSEHAALKRYLAMIADTATRGKLARAS